MNSILATAGIGSPGIPAVILFGSFFVAVIAALWCGIRKSRRAGLVAIVIFCFHAFLAPWHIEKPLDLDDPDQITEFNDGKTYRVVWIAGVTLSSIAVGIGFYRLKKQSPLNPA